MQKITHPSQPLTEEVGTELIALASGSDMISQAHCPYRQSSLLQQALAPDKMRVAFFLGAGCPMAIRVADGAGTKPLIPDVKGKVNSSRRILRASIGTLEPEQDNSDCFDLGISCGDDKKETGTRQEQVLMCLKSLG
jgi:hypothetical protein